MDNTLHIAPQTSLESVRRSTERLVDKVCRFLGDPSDPDIRQLVMDGMDYAVDTLNLAGVTLFRLQEETYDALTDGQTELELPADWDRPWGPPRLYKTDAEQTHVGDLVWMTWSDFSARKNQLLDAISGTPTIMSYKSKVDGYLQLWGPIDTTKYSKIIVPYTAEIQRLSEVDTPLLTSRLEEVLRAGATSYIMQKRHMTNPGIWQPFEQIFQRKIPMAYEGLPQSVVANLFRPDI